MNYCRLIIEEQKIESKYGIYFVETYLLKNYFASFVKSERGTISEEIKNESKLMSRGAEL